jgi:seryl-tRNA synthetase
MALENDILARLRNGEDAEKIAQELINNLNSAIATKDKEDAEAKRIAEEKAKAEQEKKALEDKKNNLADAMARAMVEYYKLSLPEVPESIIKELNGPAMRKQLDATVGLLKSLTDLSKKLDKIDFNDMDLDRVGSWFGLTSATKPDPSACKPKTSYEDAINSFFKANGL